MATATATYAGQPWNVVELRQYTLHPGQRDTMIELFEREFIETQEDVGMRIDGQFHDLNDADRFVWIRSFRDVSSRGKALTSFYVEGEAWRIHRDAANATMVDSSNVLLLRPVRPGSGFPDPTSPRPPRGARELPKSRVTATFYYCNNPVDEEFVDLFEQRVMPLMTELGARPLAYFETEPAENTFPRLPVRTGENVFAWFASFVTADDHRGHLERLAQSKEWRETVEPMLATRLGRPPERLDLAPTPRSWLR